MDADKPVDSPPDFPADLAARDHLAAAPLQGGDVNLPTHVVGVGASAGGLEALERLFRAMPTDTGMAFVVIQHLSPDFKSLMDELLERFTQMAAIPVLDSEVVRPNTIYLLPPRKDIFIEENRLVSRDRPKDGALSMPINLFFRSLAAAWGERSAAIVLSGTGSDGSIGIADVHEVGGLVLAESPDTARFDGMPVSAIATGCVDAVLAPEDMPAVLNAFAADPAAGRIYAQEAPPEGSVKEGMPAILELLHKHFHIDFASYKPSTITRRIERRISLNLQGETLESYSRRLAEDLEELNLLYKDLLIGVTRFFRDQEAFDLVRKQVIPDLLDNLAPGEELRVWVCGCSTGEEAYSLAMLFLEAFEARGRDPQIKVLATDLHEESLQKAMEGLYSAESFEEMSVELRDKYFECHDNRFYKVLPFLRKALIFSTHNLLKDPPFTKLHLVSCRNLLIYLQPQAQAKALATFHYALRVNGALLLGASESLGGLADEFETLDRQWKLFRKVRENNAILNLRSPMEQAMRAPRGLTPAGMMLTRLYDTLLDRFIPAAFLVDEQNEVLHIFGDAARYLQARKGRFSGNLLNMLASNELSLALASALRNSAKQSGAMQLKGIRNASPGKPEERLRVSVEPMLDRISSTQSYLVLIEPDEVPPHLVQPPQVHDFNIGTEVADYIRELESELQKARESLQTTVEELETSNEELQASNEELLASNEELQSTNEELHSVNEELYSVNAEHELKIEELNKLSSDLRNLMQSTDTATIFIDEDFRVRLFTPRATEVFNLLPQDVGRDLRHFQSIKPDGMLFEDIAQVMAESVPVERRLRWSNDLTYLRRCTPYRTALGRLAGVVINYTDTSLISRINRALDESEARFELILRTTPNAILVVSAHGDITLANDQAEAMFGYPKGTLVGMPIDALLSADNPLSATLELEAWFQQPAAGDLKVLRELRARRRDGGEFDAEARFGPLSIQGASYVIAAVVDVTERKRAEEAQRRALEAAQDLAQARSFFLANMSHEIRTPLNGVLGYAQIGLRHSKDNEMAQRAFNKIMASGNHLLGVINDVLDFSKIDGGKIVVEAVPVNPRALASECVELMQERADAKGLQLRLEFADDVPEGCLCDPLRLRQVLSNLISNAVKFTETGEVSVSISREGDELRYEVTDSGIGMSGAEMARIFTPFVQADPSTTRKYGGTGLGLVIAKGLVELMGGHIDMASAPGEGSTFSVRLPCRPSSLPAVVPTVVAHQERHPLPLAGFTILVAEDDTVNQYVLEENLRDEGAQVLLASDGSQALAMVAEKGPGLCDLVLMDVQMPEMSGYEATRAIHQIAPDLPVIGQTAHAYTEDRERCFDAGMIDFITKPINFDDLVAMIRRHVKR